MSLRLQSPIEVAQGIGARAKAMRLARNITQSALCNKAGVSLASLKRFENEGKGSLDLITRVGFALDVAGDFDALFVESTPASLDDLITPSSRRRASGAP